MKEEGKCAGSEGILSSRWRSSNGSLNFYGVNASQTQTGNTESCGTLFYLMWLSGRAFDWEQP